MTKTLFYTLHQITWWLVLVYFQIFNLSAQSRHFLNYTFEDGLTTNEIYTVFQHQDGSMLFGTDKGVQRFDGNKFETIPFEKESLTFSSVVFHIHTDSSANIWINTYRNGVFYLDNDTLKEHPFNDRILEHGKSEKMRYLMFDKDDDLYFFYDKQRNPFVCKVEKNGAITRIGPSNFNSLFLQASEDFETLEKFRFSLFSLNDKPIFSKPFFAVQNKKDVYYEILDTSVKSQTIIQDSSFSFFSISDPLDLKYPEGLSYCLNHHNGEIWTSYKHQLIQLDSNLNPIRVDRYKGNIQDIISIGNDQIVCTKGGTFLLTKTGRSWTKDTILEKLVSTKALVDKNGGVWVTTTTQGIFHSPNFSIKKLSLPIGENDISFIETNDSLLSFFLRPNHLEVQSLKNHQTLFAREKSVQFLYLTESYMQASSIGLDFKDYPELEAINCQLPNSKDVIQIPGTDTLVIATHSYGVQYLSKGGNWFKEKQNSLDTNTPNFSVCFFKKQLYVGDAQGVFILSRNTGEKKRFLPQIISGHINDIKHTKDCLLISTLNNGLFVCSENEMLYHSEIQGSLIPRNCGKMTIENDSTFWIASDAGLLKAELCKQGVSSTLFTTDDGLISNGINDVSISNGVIYLGTDQGICFVNTEDLTITTTSIPFRVYFPNLKFENKNNRALIELKKGKRDIYLVVDEKSIRYNSGLKYSYVLNNKENGAIISPQNSISFGNLKPGLNKISINIANANGLWNSSPRTITIWAPPYFFEKSSFKMLVVLIGLSLIITSIYLFYRQKDRSRKRKFDFALAQYSTLSLQLSPHFIFNSLNNIQYLSVSKNYISVNQFVSNLARLTRNILEHSKLQLIPLETEIENLKLYLDIEKIRFEHKPMELSFEIDPKLNLKQLLIPPMIFQPTVENAIWHGLLNKEGNRSLKIQMMASERGFEVKIIDNGIGLHTPQKDGLKIKGQTSIGIKNTQQRIDLYNQMNLGVARFTLEELKEGTKAIGTVAYFYFKPTSKSTQ